ncbi:MAG: lysophospholipid acyltransferase family protein [Alphaproteobacteria bacterium]|nr:lysophospholipid acyltransferase family protein [Alphaproteobacteria bacterium]
MKKLKSLWKKFWRKFFGLHTVQWILASIIFLGIYLVYFTSKKVIHGEKIFRAHRRKPAIFVFWHGRSMMLSPIVRRYGFRGFAIASRHKDGRLMAKIQRLFGLRAIFGSTGREGAVSALREGVRRLNQGYILALSPDGPKGPRMRLNDGVLYFARMTGAPIIPVCFTSSRPWFQKRWDRYLIATPFSKIVCNVGEPIFINKDNFDSMREHLEKFMVKQLHETDAEFGLSKIEPGELTTK